MNADFPSSDDYQAAAWLLACDVAAIKAVAQVEAGAEGAFLDTGEPVILFERHKFHRYTDGRFAGARAPGLPAAVSLLSSPKAGGYGAVGIQHRKLAAAVLLDREAALRATSWGLFQVLGDNYAACGYDSVQRLVTAAYRGVSDHLRMFTQFIRHDSRLVDAIRDHDWPGFAAIYNGPAYAINEYDRKMAAAFTAAERAA